MSASLLSGVPSAGEWLADHQVVGELGRGGMATVLDVVHGPTGERRAIKLMLPVRNSEEQRARFLREFEALRRIEHPQVLRVFEAGWWGDRPYFSMERLEGRDLAHAVEEWRELPPAERFRRAESVLVQVARALDAIHGLGMIHRDVTPANIMLADDGSVKLMDFGVVKAPGVDLTVDGEVVGTVAYIAPEQIGNRPVDGRTDLYSLGAVLYLMLTGRRPFNARTVAGYLDKHLNLAARPPREIHPTLPEHLDRICMRLLEKDPDHRFASASHLLHSLQAKDPPSEPVTLGPGWNPPLVGRAAELVLLREWLSSLEQERRGLLVLRGPSGMGKRRLANVLMELARRAGIPAHRSVVDPRDARPFAPLRPVVVELGGPGRDAAVFDAGVPRDRWAVLALAKELLPPGLRVLVLERAEWADGGTADLLAYLVRNAFGVGLVLVQGEERGRDVWAEALEPEAVVRAPAVVEVGPWSQAAVEELLLSLAAEGPGVRQLAARLHEESGGRPQFVVEMVQALFDRGVLQVPAGHRRAALTWTPAMLQDDPLPVPASLEQAMARTWEGLSRPARAVLSVLALAFDSTPREVLEAASMLSPQTFDAALDELRGCGLLDAQSAQPALLEPRWSDFVDRADPDGVRVAHRALGHALERSYRGRTGEVVEALALHFERGEVFAKAVRYLVQAARGRLESGFVPEALERYERALAAERHARDWLTLEDGDRLRLEVELGRAQALFLVGRWQEAQEAARLAEGLARDLDDPRWVALVATELGTQARTTGDAATAEAQLHRALDAAERAGDARLRVAAQNELGGVAWRKGELDAARRHWLEALAGSEAVGDERGLANGTSGLGVLAFCRGDIADARRYTERAIEVCERSRFFERLVVCRCNLMEIYHLTGHFQRGLEVADQAIVQAREVGHRYGLGLGLQYRAMMLVDLGHLADAEEQATAALQIHQRLGEHASELAALVVLTRAAVAAGRWDVAEERVHTALGLVENYDTEGFSPILHAWSAAALAVRGEAGLAQAALERARAARHAWPHQQVRGDLNVARAHALLGDREQAAAWAEQALRISDSCGFRYYALRARQLLVRTGTDPAQVARHRRIADALGRSLAAGLPRDLGDAFLRHQGLIE